MVNDMFIDIGILLVYSVYSVYINFSWMIESDI